MKLYKLLSILFILYVGIELTVVSAQQPNVSNNIKKCFSLPDIEKTEPTGSDVQVFQQISLLVEQEPHSSVEKPSYDLLKKLEGFLPQIQSSIFRGMVVMGLINEYIGLNDIREVERLVDKELKRSDVDKTTVLRITNAFVTCQSNIPKCKKLLEDVLRRSDLSRKQRFYFQGRYALLCDFQEKIKVLSEIEKEFPEEKTCFAVFLEQAAHSLKNPEEAFMLMSKISDVDPLLFKDVQIVKNYIHFAEQVNKLESAIKIALEFVQSDPNHPESQYIFYKLGSLYFELGEYNKSMEFYQKVIDFPIQNTEESKSLISIAKTNYAVAHSKLNKIGFVSYENIEQKIEKSEWSVARLFCLILGSAFILLWFFLRKTKHKTNDTTQHQ
jgi:tetratricopeptide (TPR) repeat protein